MMGSREDYIAGIDLLRSKRPDHYILKDLTSGHTPMNEAYLKSALEDADLSPNERLQSSSDDLSSVGNQNKSSVSVLFGRRAKLSNSFHDATSDAQRAYISKEIKALQIKINDRRSQHQNKPEADRFPIPITPLQKQKKIMNLRSQISRKKKEIETLFRLPDEHPKRSKLPKCQIKLSELKLHLAHVENSLAITTV